MNGLRSDESTGLESWLLESLKSIPLDSFIMQSE